jgi:hypothetical protein
MDTRKIDWIQEFESKFTNHQLISQLKKMNFHGKVVVNFAEGSPCTVHLEWCVKAYTDLNINDGGRDATS